MPEFIGQQEPSLSETFADLRRIVLGPAQPAVGDQAAGHGVTGVIAAVPDRQPLAKDGIWRVTLNGEAFGRLARLSGRKRDGVWQMLQIDDVTDEQLEIYEAAMRDAPEETGTAPAVNAPRAAA